VEPRAASMPAEEREVIAEEARVLDVPSVEVVLRKGVAAAPTISQEKISRVEESKDLACSAELK
tara:strand:- start:3472 stop:3663 length:192 start_codon:yes stop_codon:yes gene_type:complete